jgi:hypothetical protein
VTPSEALLYFPAEDKGIEPYQHFLQQEKTWCVRNPLVPLVWFKRLKRQSVYREAAVVLGFESGLDQYLNLTNRCSSNSKLIKDCLLHYNSVKSIRQHELFRSASITELIQVMTHYLEDFRVFSECWPYVLANEEVIMLSREPDPIYMLEISSRIPWLTFQDLRVGECDIPTELLLESSRLNRLHQQFRRNAD